MDRKADAVRAEFRGIHFFWIVTAFFCVIVGVDGFFITRAVGTFPGEDVPNSYVQGLDFNRTIAQRAAQAELGWTAEIGLSDETPHLLILRIFTRSGDPIDGLEVNASVRVIGHPTDDNRSLTPAGKGAYTILTDLAPAARIAVTATAKWPGRDEPVFVASKTLVVK